MTNLFGIMHEMKYCFVCEFLRLINVCNKESSRTNTQKTESTAWFFDSSVNKYKFVLPFLRCSEGIESVSATREEEVPCGNATTQLKMFTVQQLFTLLKDTAKSASRH